MWLTLSRAEGSHCVPLSFNYFPIENLNEYFTRWTLLEPRLNLSSTYATTILSQKV